MKRSVYLILNKVEKRFSAKIIFAFFDVILVEMSPSGAFLLQVLNGWGQYEK